MTSLAQGQQVLIGFAEAVAAPECVFSLQKAGFSVVAFARRETQPVIGRIKGVRVVQLVAPEHDVEQTIGELTALARTLGPLPCLALDDAGLYVLAAVAERGALRVEEGEGVTRTSIALDKLAQFECARASGFEVPETSTIRAYEDLVELDRFPCFLRPRLAVYRSGDHLLKGRTYQVHGRDELEAIHAQWQGACELLAQPLVVGCGEGIFAFAKGGQLQAYHGHRRLRMVNPLGSGSSACVSVKPEAELLECTREFAGKADWAGPFMIELLRDQAGKCWFVELNGRMWGSLALARRLGLEYPAWSVQATLDHGCGIPSQEDPPDGVVCRHLGRDLVHLAAVLFARRPRGPQVFPSRWTTGWRVLSFRRREHYYNLWAGTFGVFAVDTVSTVARKTSLYSLWQHWQRQWRRLGGFAARPLLRRKQGSPQVIQRFRQSVATARSVLVLCYGNINRSPLAALLIGEQAGQEICIESAGFHQKKGRPVDPVMVQVAQRSGLEVGGCTSKVVGLDQVLKADVILVMETWHLQRLWTLYPEARQKSFLLGTGQGRRGAPVEVEDPFGGPEAAYQDCLAELRRLATRIADLLGDQA